MSCRATCRKAGARTARRTPLARVALALLLAAGAVNAPPARGEAVAPTSRSIAVALDGITTEVDVHVPAGRPAGAAIVAHGWTRSKAQHRDLGLALAGAGIVAIVPDLPNVVDLWGNGTLVVELAAELEAGAQGLPRMPRSSLLLIGTSAGGLATVYAASKLPGLAGWIGLDPVDRTGTGIHAATQLDSPAVVLLGDSSACNLFGSGRSIARATPRLVRLEKFDGASHCDFESPTSKFCTRLCGGASRDRQDAILRETVAASIELLRQSADARHDPGYAPDADPPPLQPDKADRAPAGDAAAH